MPVFEENTFVREVLIVRPASDAPWASQQTKIVVVTRDGAPYNEQYLPAEPLNVADVGEVLAPAFIDLTNERDAANAARDAAADALTEMTADRDAQAQARAQAEATSAELATALAEAQAQLAALQAAS
jgi:hypothetical protein